jgi:hypothetical protein
MKLKTTVVRVLFVSSLLTLLGGCGALQNVQPWEKGALSKPEMTLDGDAQEQMFNEHILASREGASGGSGAGGGGCGCY